MLVMHDEMEQEDSIADGIERYFKMQIVSLQHCIARLGQMVVFIPDRKCKDLLSYRCPYRVPQCRYR